jgi:hypothetical protein
VPTEWVRIPWLLPLAPAREGRFDPSRSRSSALPPAPPIIAVSGFDAFGILEPGVLEAWEDGLTCEALLFALKPSQLPATPVAPDSFFSVIHLNHDRITAQTQHQPLPLGDQMHHHPVSVLQPKVARARVAESKAIAALSVGSGEVAYIP